MPETKDFYVVYNQAGLYVDEINAFFTTAATKDLLHAKRYTDIADAERAARKAGGEVLHYKITPFDDGNREIEMLRAAVTQMQRERDEARQMVKDLQEEIRDLKGGN